MQQLTVKQQLIYDYLRQYTAKYGYPPSVREIALAVGLKSPSTVHFHLKTLDKCGLIARSTGRNRAITPLEQGETEEKPFCCQIPIRQVSPVEELCADKGYTESFLSLHVEHDGECFAVQMWDESMQGLGILKGDYLVVRRQDSAECGAIVLARHEGKALCRQLSSEKGAVWLMPANPWFARIAQSDCQIIGKVTTVIRYCE